MTLHSYQLEPNLHLHQTTQAYYVLDYFGWRKPNNPDFLNDIKNDFGRNSKEILNEATRNLIISCYNEINEVIKRETLDTICIVPRAKTRSYYAENQLLFLKTIQLIVSNIDVIDGTDYIIRIKNTKTTHFHNKPEYGGDGDLPYPGITNDTCSISSNVKGKNILLIDDIYTKTINIDEDCIQALLDKGANKVVLFTIAKTLHSNDSLEKALEALRTQIRVKLGSQTKNVDDNSPF
ncbi:hypothetical protein [Glaesserella parasuis]|uniref:Phosphoribosyltransferase n=1 Tax=Glaesserella parasuis TaxID=738 RepID=A0AAJ6AEF4_GLAPU|nr:hypothetical protein [Glaesserella parasuis]MDE4002685.1 hypothetical protein [Glaesserella parasuis]MDE4021103.1 hypothetical protein [Glaesserella parasuis]MDG6361734.1 hypothetical protein [Glaesserella parasuis]MDO9814802.1 hypothetical protein [Glaesserella parasuis]WGE09795.1 hypothetical protein QBL01_11355 [Glaesserella parasuis]